MLLHKYKGFDLFSQITIIYPDGHFFTGNDLTDNHCIQVANELHQKCIIYTKLLDGNVLPEKALLEIPIILEEPQYSLICDCSTYLNQIPQLIVITKNKAYPSFQEFAKDFGIPIEEEVISSRILANY